MEATSTWFRSGLCSPRRTLHSRTRTIIRPFRGYGDLNQFTNNIYANYNALQVTWAHQAKMATIQLNYTYGKALGHCQPEWWAMLGAASATLDPFNLRNNYGIQPGDRRQLFNATYSIDLPSPVHNNKIAAGVVNGWQISGITQIESGANLTYNRAPTNFNMQLNGAILPGTQNIVNPDGSTGVANQQSINIGDECHPAQPDTDVRSPKNLGPHQYINGGCFAVPTSAGQNGPTLLPAVYGPAFFNSDLGIFKNFKIKESMKLQIPCSGL